VNELIEEIESLKAIIAGLQQQLLRIGNQEGVLKAAYLEGQMAKKQPSPPEQRKARQWVGLTDEEVAELSAYVYAGDPQYVRLIETKLKEKNA
jgi:hypothetical protein